jgi:hypothetical protein
VSFRKQASDAEALSEIVEQIEGLVAGSPKEEQRHEDTNPFTALLDFRKAKGSFWLF